MKNQVAVCLNIIFFLAIASTSSQVQQVRFHEVLLQEGSSWGAAVYDIKQDGEGYIWFATSEGLQRYDGYHLRSYMHDPLNPGSLAGNIVGSVQVDRKGYIWTGTLGQGLDRLDPASGIFSHFRCRLDDATSLSSDTVTKILEDHEGNLWIGTQTGLSMMDQKTGKFTRYLHDPNDPSSLSKGRVRVVYEDRQGTLWIGTGRNISSIGPGEGGLNRLDKNTGKFVRYMHEPGNPNSLIGNRALAIFEDSRGTFWIGTSGSGVHNMDRKKGTFETYFHDPANPGKLTHPSLSYKNLPDSYTSFISEDATGAIWMGTKQNGLYRYDGKTQRVSHYESDSSSGFTDKSPWTAYTSREGVMWVSTQQRGLFKMDPCRNYIPHYATGFPVFAICEDKSGSIWLGHHLRGEGLIQIDRNIGSTKKFLADTLNPHSLSSNFIWAIHEDRQETLWIGTTEGLNRFNRKEQSFSRYRHDPNNASSLTSNTIRAIYEDSQGSFWIGTNQGLNLMNRQTGEFTHYRNNTMDGNSRSSDSVTCITEDHLGNLWIGTPTDIKMLIRQTGKFKHYLNKSNVFALFEDTDSILWAGTESGFYRFNRAVDSFSLFIDAASNINSNTSVGAILEDNHKNIWLHSSAGIFSLNRSRNQIIMYGRNYGVFFSEWAKAYKGTRGEFFYPNFTGYYAFFPDQLLRNSKPPQVVLSEFRLGDQPVKPGNNSPLSVPLGQAKEIRLKYNQNIFSFDFAGIHFSSPEDNRHLFMLENLDKTWRKGDAEKTAYYYDVPPGRYIFRVKAANNEGIWREKAITVIIDPPWWRTWWAYVIYALLIAGGIWAIVYYRSRSLRRKNRLLEAKVTQRTAELKQQKEELQGTLEDLKATQTQLVQREKMASLGELTAGIAHEIQNPLNFVNNFSDVNTELIEELKEEQKKESRDFQNENEILNNIDQNLQKISHHGKRADAIVKSMLQHSRTTTGQKELTDINALADEYLRLSYHGLRAKDKSFNATFETHFDKSLEKINVIPQDMGRVLLNLFNNALYSVMEKKKQLGNTHLPDGQGYEPMVTVRTRKLNSTRAGRTGSFGSALGDGGQIEIRIRDNGVGIPQKVLDKIFQPFFTTKPAGEGTGLGLSLSYDIIKAHNGELEVETKVGEYAEFKILLPA